MKTIAINDIIISDQRRKTNPDKVKELAESIGRSGLINPVTITTDQKLVAGAHRIEALRLLNKDEVSCIVMNLNEHEAELAEIDENLIRQELSELDKSLAIARREEILKEMALRAEAGSNQHTQGGGAKFAPPPKTTKEIAQESGMSERSLQLKKQIGNNVKDVADIIRDTPIADNQSQLQKLSKISDKELQKKVAEKVKNEAKTVDNALKELNPKEHPEPEKETTGNQGKEIESPDKVAVYIDKETYERGTIYAKVKNLTIEQLVEKLIKERAE